MRGRWLKIGGPVPMNVDLSNITMMNRVFKPAAPSAALVVVAGIDELMSYTDVVDAGKWYGELLKSLINLRTR
jgi:hypothetical protein